MKIGQFSWPKDTRRPNIPQTFEKLDNTFFSLGQDVDYYKAMMALPELDRVAILAGLRDVTLDTARYDRALSEDVMTTSLMRSVDGRDVEIEFRNVLKGGAELTPYAFSYRPPPPDDEIIRMVGGAMELAFSVEPMSTPPTNIHALVGRNGVGKTHLLNGMTRALVDPATSDSRNGSFDWTDHIDLTDSRPEAFANLVSVTFSAFDAFLLIDRPSTADEERIGYENIGLRKRRSEGASEIVLRDIEELSSDFVRSVGVCSKGPRRQRWRNALKTLETDSLFVEIGVADLADQSDEAAFEDAARALFRRLSSGHKIVLLTITKLVELVKERSLVLMDEPEAHLHPPLLSAFVRALSDLMTNRNGVAFIATHSPVVLQEVPASCVWKISRHDVASKAERPEIETFAENVGTLTREVFGLDVDRSGFHKMIREIVEKEATFEDAVARFDSEIGGQGEALIQAMIATRPQDAAE